MFNKLARKIFTSQQDLGHIAPTGQLKRGAAVWANLERWTSNMPENTKRKYRACIREFCELFYIDQTSAQGAETFLSVNAENAYEYIEWCKSRPAQPGRSSLVSDKVSLSTVRNKVIVLYSVFKHCVALGLIDSNPFELPKEQMKRVQGNDRRPHQLVPFEKVREIFELNWSLWRDGTRDKAIMAALFGGGLRRSEVIKLRLLDIRSLPSGRLNLVLRDTKRQRSETQDVPQWASEILSAWVKKRRDEGGKDMDPLFTRYIDKKPTNAFMDERTFLRTFKRCLSRVGLGPEYSCHAGRVTTVTKLLRSGVPIQDVSKWVRHSSIQTTIKYHRYDEYDVQKASDALDYKKTGNG